MLMGTGVHVRIGSSPVSPTKYVSVGTGGNCNSPIGWVPGQLVWVRIPSDTQKTQKYITNTCFSRIYYVNLHISSLIKMIKN